MKTRFAIPIRIALLLSVVLIPACGGSSSGGVWPSTVFRVTVTTLPDGVSGAAYSEFVTVQDGAAPYVWSVLSGTLPGGLALNPATGEISGVPLPVNGLNGFVIRVTDVNGLLANQFLTITITGGAVTPLAVSAAPLQNGSVNAGYLPGVAVTGGTPPYSYAITLGALPDGLTLDYSSGPPAVPEHILYATNQLAKLIGRLDGCEPRSRPGGPGGGTGPLANRSSRRGVPSGRLGFLGVLG